MNIKKVFVSCLLCISLLAACGGGSGGGGGTLDPQRVEKLFLLSETGTPLPQVLTALYFLLASQCPEGDTTSTVTIGLGEVECENGGTWLVSGTTDCKKTTESASRIIITVENTANSFVTLTNCASTVSVDMDDDGTNDTVNISLNGNVNPFSMTNSTIDLQLSGTIATSIVINGIAALGRNSMQISGDVSATITYTNDFIFNDYDPIQGSGTQTCAQNTVSAVEGGNTGTCEIQIDCTSCQ